MSALSVLSAREARRYYRHTVAAFLGGVCPHCARPVADLLDSEIDECRRIVSYWPAATLVEIAARQARRAA